MFDKVGLEDFNPAWYADKDWGIIAIAIAMAWQMTGSTMALYLAGIRGISQDLREAAQIDGAGTLTTYRYVIIPMLKPVTMTAFIILFGLALRAFDIVAAISGSGAAYATDTFGYHNFQLAFQDSQFSCAAVIAVVMILISGLWWCRICGVSGRRCEMTQHLRWGWARVGIYGVLIAFALFYLMPVYVVLVNGLKPFSEVSLQKMWDLPVSGLSLESFQKGWDAVAPNFIASLKITVPTALISSFIGSINGYIFAKWRFRYSNVIFLLVLFGLFLPYQGILIPLVQVLVKIGIYGSIAGLIITHTISGSRSPL